MQPWTEAYADILVGLAIIAAVVAVFVVAPAVSTRRRRGYPLPPYRRVTSHTRTVRRPRR